MPRSLSAAFLAFLTALLLAAPSFAQEPTRPTIESSGKSERARATRPRYANTAERWRGLPSLRAAGTHPIGTTGSEKVYEHLPSVNFCLEGQYGGAFSVPRF